MADSQVDAFSGMGRVRDAVHVYLDSGSRTVNVDEMDTDPVVNVELSGIQLATMPVWSALTACEKTLSSMW
ncbi:MAG: hypothetical protein VB144_14595 [Clostridia bacterium]|nr:hypothetical protein [Clostridia bacterium]